MTDQVHWWLAALSFVMGLVLTFTLMVRPANTQVPLWALLGLGVKPEPPLQEDAPAESPAPKPVQAPAMRVSAAEAPTEQIPVIKTRPARKAVPRDPPTKRIGVLTDPETERIPVIKATGTKRVPAKKKAPGKRVPAKKIPAKKIPAKKVPAKKRPAARRIPATDDVPTTEIPLMKYSPYGPGSARANLDGSGPEGWTVKGRTDSRLFFNPGDPGYDETEAQVWFENEDFATKAFFMSARKRARKG